MSRNTADATKAARPKGEIFRHKIIVVKYLKPLMTVCTFKKGPDFMQQTVFDINIDLCRKVS